jgi:elongation factor Ts
VIDMSVEISASLVKQLRDRTGAGMMECKAALQEANGDIEAANTVLRKRGLAQAAKKVGRSTSEGVIGSYIHLGGKIGVLVEVNCESDFVARTDDFQNLVKEIGLHIAAASPIYARREDVPADVLERERSIYRAQMENSGKPASVVTNRRGQAQCLLRADRAHRPAVDPRPKGHGRSGHHGPDRQARREHRDPPLRAL